MSKRTGRAASVDGLWKLHRELIVWFREYLDSPEPKSGAVIAELVKFLSDNGAVVNAKTERELRTHSEILAGLTVPFPTATSQ
jgi:hypothetical protein